MVYVHEQNMPKMRFKKSLKKNHLKPLKRAVLNLEEKETYHVSISIYNFLLKMLK
jgi:hypothetical protein